jgi:hypothetical protein
MQIAMIVTVCKGHMAEEPEPSMDVGQADSVMYP